MSEVGGHLSLQDGKDRLQIQDSAIKEDDGDKHPIAPDTFDEKFQTTKWEIWAYYAWVTNWLLHMWLTWRADITLGTTDCPCLVGLLQLEYMTSGLTAADFAPTAFQNLLNQAAGADGVLTFAGRNRTINSIVLLCNGISFAVQIVVFLVIGSFADFGNWRPNILIVLSVVAYAIGFAWLGVHVSDEWHAAAGLYIVGLIAYQTTLTFWTAAFPGLARNTAEMKVKGEAFAAGAVSREEYDYADSMKRSQLANVAFYVQSVGEIFILAVIVGVMFGLEVNKSQANNNWGLSVLIAFAAGVWLLVSLPWFLLEKRRPGQDPGRRNIAVAGLWQLYYAVRQVWKLKQSLIYLIGKTPACLYLWLVVLLTFLEDTSSSVTR
jgi:F0F1-type ATP synthase assembly protein I